MPHIKHKKEGKKVLVHMAYYTTEAELVGEAERSARVRLPEMKIGPFTFPSEEIWVDRKNVEIIQY